MLQPGRIEQVAKKALASAELFVGWFPGYGFGGLVYPCACWSILERDGEFIIVGVCCSDFPNSFFAFPCFKIFRQFYRRRSVHVENGDEKICRAAELAVGSNYFQFVFSCFVVVCLPDAALIERRGKGVRYSVAINISFWN